MRRLFPTTLAAAAVLIAACDSGELAPGPASSTQGSAVAQQATAVAAPAPQPQHTAAAPAGHAPAAAISWANSLNWLDYQAGLSAAKASGKPIMLLVYADWCPKCRALAPVFERADVKALAKNLVVVRQNQDDDPAWLEQLSDGRGSYVPRVIFLNANGAPLKEITSGHPRYPYFYAAENPDALLSSLKQVLRI